MDTAMNNGWIKLHRKLTEWEWYTDDSTFRVFLHLLLKANHQPNQWRGIDIDTGEVLTGRKKLAEELRISERSVRTALSHLISTNELTIKTTTQYSLIKINNWIKYQTTDQQDDQQQTNDRPSTDQRPTTNKKEKNVKNEKNEKEEREPSPNSSIKILDDPTTLQELQGKFPDANVPLEIEKIKDWLASKGKVQKDYVAFARNWIRKNDAYNRIHSRKVVSVK